MPLQRLSGRNIDGTVKPSSQRSDQPPGPVGRTDAGGLVRTRRGVDGGADQGFVYGRRSLGPALPDEPTLLLANSGHEPARLPGLGPVPGHPGVGYAAVRALAERQMASALGNAPLALGRSPGGLSCGLARPGVGGCGAVHPTDRASLPRVPSVGRGQLSPSDGSGRRAGWLGSGRRLGQASSRIHPPIAVAWFPKRLARRSGHRPG